MGEGEDELWFRTFFSFEGEAKLRESEEVAMEVAKEERKKVVVRVDLTPRAREGNE